MNTYLRILAICIFYFTKWLIKIFCSFSIRFLFIRDLQKFFFVFCWESFVRYVYYKYLLPLSGLSFLSQWRPLMKRNSYLISIFPLWLVFFMSWLRNFCLFKGQEVVLFCFLLDRSFSILPLAFISALLRHYLYVLWSRSQDIFFINGYQWS